MIQKQYNFFAQNSCSNESQIISIDKNIPQFQTLNYISLQGISIPNTIYNVQNLFTIQIDGINIDIPAGNISFQQLIQLLKNTLGSNYIVKEYNFEKTQTGKLFLQKYNQSQMAINIPENRQSFFGNFYFDETLLAYISTNVCDMTINKQIRVCCNAIQNLYQQNGRFDILYSFQITSTPFSQYFSIKNIDMIQNKQKYNKCTSIQFQLLNENSEPIIFNNCASYYIQFSLFFLISDFTKFLLDNQKIMIELLRLNNEIQIFGQQKKNEIKKLLDPDSDKDSDQ